MKILITGGCGFVGSIIANFLIKKLKKCKKDNSNLIFLSSSRVYSIDNLREIIKKKNIIRPIKSKKIINEKFETSEARSLYGFTKLSSENLIQELFYKTILKFLINRFGVIAGPWQFGKQDQGFVPLWVARHLFKKKLSYIGFGGLGHQVRDILHIDDVCEIIFLQIRNLNKISNKLFNIGGGIKNVISLKRLTTKCEKLTNNKIKFNRILRTSIYDIPFYITDNSKIKKFYNWSPKKNVDTILQDIYTWLIKNKKVRKFF